MPNILCNIQCLVFKWKQINFIHQYHTSLPIFMVKKEKSCKNPTKNKQIDRARQGRCKKVVIYASDTILLRLI